MSDNPYRSPNVAQEDAVPQAAPRQPPSFWTWIATLIVLGATLLFGPGVPKIGFANWVNIGIVTTIVSIWIYLARRARHRT